MAINDDELNIGMGLDGEEDVISGVERVQRIIEQANKNINQSFDNAADVTKTFNQNLLILEKSVVTLTRQYASLGRAGEKGFEEISSRQQAALDYLTKVQNRLREIDIEVSKPGTKKSRIAELKKEAKELSNQLGLMTRDLLALQQLDIVLKAKILPAPGRSGYGSRDALGGIADALNIPGLGAGLGAAAGIAAVSFALHKFIDYSQIALDRTSKLIGSQRVLASAAIEAGISIDKLAEVNKNFANLVGLSDVRAASTVEKLAQLTTRSQHPENIEKLSKGLANIAAARGLDPTQLEALVQQIITGQDEGYKKLGLPNPSELQRRYAERNNRSVESLTTIEKAQIFQDEFLKKAELFNGSAEAKINSLDGAVAKLYANLDNLANSVSKFFAGSPDAAVLIDDITAAVKRLSGSLDELSAKQLAGTLTEADIKDAAKPGVISEVRKILGLGGLLGGGLLKLLTLGGSFDLGSGAGEVGESLLDYGAGELEQNTQELNEDVIRRRLNAQRKLIVDQDRIASERRVDLARELAEEDRNKRRKQELERFDELFKKRRDDPTKVAEALEQIRNYGVVGTKVFDEQELQRRVSEQYAKLKPEEIQRLGQLGVSGEAAIKERLTKQIREQMQAALDVENRALFNSEELEKLIERGQQELSNAVQKMYNRVLADPNIRIEKVLETLGQIREDKRLFPEVQEALIREAEEIQRRMAKISQALVSDVQNLYVTEAVTRTGNPLVKDLYEIEEAFRKTQERFAPFGKEFAETMAKVAKNEALDKLESKLYRLDDSALRLRQEAESLQNIPETQTDAFGRRLDRVSRTAEFQISNADLRRQLEIEKFYAETYSPYNKDRTFLIDKYGYSGADRLQEGFQRAPGESPQETKKRLDQYVDSSVKIKDALEDIKKVRGIDLLETGTYGKEAIAKALLDRLPSREELLPRLESYGETRLEAQEILEQRAKLQEILVQGNKRRFQDFLVEQQNLDKNRRNAQERLDLLTKSGLNDVEKLEQYLAITSELGIAELTPEQRQGRISAGLNLASIREKQRQEARDEMKKITGFIDTLNDQLQKKGLKVDLTDKVITEVRVTSELNANKRTRRGDQSDTNSEYK